MKRAQATSAPERRAAHRIAALAGLTVIVAMWTVTVGSAGLPVSDVMGVVASHIPGIDIEITWDRTTDAIVNMRRTPATPSHSSTILTPGKLLRRYDTASSWSNP